MKNAPDIMRQNCLVYMEGGHNKVANQVILDNMEYIKEKIRPMEKVFDWEGPLPMKFIYLPNVATEYEDNIKYYVPTLNRYENIPQLPTNALATFLNISKIPPCFFRYECENYDEDGGEAYPVSVMMLQMVKPCSMTYLRNMPSSTKSKRKRMKDRKP